MTRLLALLPLGLALLLPLAHADEDSAETCLRAKVWEGYGDGWGIRTLTATTLGSGATRNYLVTLYKGNDYKVQTCADENVKNLDVLLYDLDGNVVKRDETSDREPVVTFTPDATSTYYIVVHARELVDPASKAGAAMAVVYK